jgi:ElaB/YqjD/DUF883 family membrane-anchored ribosome-binding protein
MTTKLEEHVRETAEQIEETVRASKATVAETLKEGSRSAERLLRKGRFAVEDSVAEATHRIKHEPLAYVTGAFAAGTIVGILVGLLLGRGNKRS